MVNRNAKNKKICTFFPFIPLLLRKIYFMSTTFHSLKIKAIKRETSDTVSINFDVPADLNAAFEFIPGQYLTLKALINGEDVRRSYSICASPQEKELIVAVKAIENGLFSNYATKKLQVGDTLEVMSPMGNFQIKTNSGNSKNYIFYAAGSGITPVISMVKSILSDEPNSNVQLYYGTKTATETIFRSSLEALNNEYINFNLTYITSREDSGDSETNGRIDTAKCATFYAKSQSNVKIDGIYACGPEEMIKTVQEFYTGKGLGDKVHFELFKATAPVVNSLPLDSSAPVQSNVTVIIDDESYKFSLNTVGKNILQAAQDEDADVPFSCKGGVCCTCRAKVLEGTVRMDMNFALEADEVANGFILTCQAHPTSEKVVISFDEL